MQLRVDFDVTTDPSVDQVLANLRYSQAASQLPPDVVNQGVTVIKSVTSPLGLFALYSPKGTYDSLFLANYAYVNINDPMTRVSGIGQVLIFGASQYAIRLWINPDTLAKLDITVNEIASALQAQNTVNPAGQLGGDPVPRGQEFTYTVLAQGRLVSLADFENVVVRARPDGALVRVKDVGRVELGAESYSTASRYQGRDAVGFGVLQLPTANALQVFRDVDAEIKRLSARFPPGLKIEIAFDTTTVVAESIREVVTTLLEAIGLVVLVMFLFLQDWRTTLIPAITIPVSLIGAFAFVKLFGFSINTLTLFGITLATGLVVDDAIVVIENIERHIHEHNRPSREAASEAMVEVTGAVIATALVLAAVFVPVAFFPGTTGRLYQQFALTIAVSMVISAFNALTLTPALAGVLLGRTGKPKGAFFRVVNRVIDGGSSMMVTGLRGLVRDRR
jgi:HAE1 family hydrophobic/amphiphilic exporter-1